MVHVISHVSYRQTLKNLRSDAQQRLQVRLSQQTVADQLLSDHGITPAASVRSPGVGGGGHANRGGTGA